ncbi:MAG: DUF3526 domain-containing protein [Balneolales bacterium]|nr:DUF3526 domain-containing protein [Balneolales bacterium]
MKHIFRIIQFEWKSLWRSNVVKLLLFIVFGTGIYGIYFGKFEIDRQNARIAQVQDFEEKEFQKLLEWVQLDTTIAENKQKYLEAVSPAGFGFNRHFTYYFTNPASPLAGLSLGQRDLYPSYFGISVADLVRQTNVSELANPMKLLSGNFDLSYVIVFIFPLLIVALFYNLYASEKEEGTLSLLRAQPVSLSVAFVSKGVLRFIIVAVLLLVLLILAFLIQGISLSEHALLFSKWLVLSLSYCIFWTIVMAALIGFKQSSTITAMLGLSSWVLFTIVSPALLNLLILTNTSVPNRAEATHLIREYNGDIWASSYDFVFDKFYKEHPEYDFRDTTDFNKWYYAGFTLLDQRADSLLNEFETYSSKRNELIGRWEWIAPSAMVHEMFSTIAETDRESYLQFQRDLKHFHDELKGIYYPKIYSSTLFEPEDLLLLQSKVTF